MKNWFTEIRYSRLDLLAIFVIMGIIMTVLDHLSVSWS